MRRLIGALAIAASLTLPAAANATPSVVQFSFAVSGQPTVFSAVYAAGDDILFQQVYGGYTLNITADSDNLYGPSALGTDPFLSFAIQVSNVGANPPANPIKVGMSINGLPAPAASLIGFNSSFTGIFQTASTANFQSYYDPNNALFGRAITLAQFDGVSRQSNSYDQTVDLAVSQQYSMSLYTTLNPVAYAHPTLDAQLTANPASAADTTSTPEPASASLVALGLAALAVARRRRARSI